MRLQLAREINPFENNWPPKQFQEVKQWMGNEMPVFKQGGLVSRKANPELGINLQSWPTLAVGASSRNILPTFFTIPTGRPIYSETWVGLT